MIYFIALAVFHISSCLRLHVHQKYYDSQDYQQELSSRQEQFDQDLQQISAIIKAMKAQLQQRNLTKNKEVYHTIGEPC